MKKNMLILVVGIVLTLLFLLSGGFLYRILAIYTLPNIYVYLRLKSLLAKKIERVVFTLLYVLLAAAFPIAEMAAHATGAAPLRTLLAAAFYALPFLLYLFLFLLLHDLLLGLNRLLKIVPREVVTSRKFRLASLCILLVLAAAVVVKGSLDFDAMKVNEYRIQVPRRSSTLKRLRIALVADFHLGDLTHRGFMARLVEKLNALDPDIVLIPGDILEGDRGDLQTIEYARQFRLIRTKWGVYASPGNHEHHRGEARTDFFADSGIRMLQDEQAVIDSAFILVGRNDGGHGRENRKTLAELLRGTPAGLPVIVLDHRPTGLVQASQAGLDIQVSAHSHHGQLFPFNLITKLQYELSWGYKKIGETHFFVTSGIQAWGPRVRTAGESEIMLIEVAFIG